MPEFTEEVKRHESLRIMWHEASNVDPKRVENPIPALTAQIGNIATMTLGSASQAQVFDEYAKLGGLVSAVLEACAPRILPARLDALRNLGLTRAELGEPAPDSVPTSERVAVERAWEEAAKAGATAYEKSAWDSDLIDEEDIGNMKAALQAVVAGLE